MSLTPKDIAEITKLLEDSSFAELELEIDGLKIHLKRAGATPAAQGVIPDLLAKGDAPAAGSSPFAREAGKSGMTPSTDVLAPLLGTFYRAPKPGAPPFVTEGAAVEPDTIIGIIEVMKLMNTVRAGVPGIVLEICAQDGKLVEHGETLLRIDARGAR